MVTMTKMVRLSSRDGMSNAPSVMIEASRFGTAVMHGPEGPGVEAGSSMLGKVAVRIGPVGLGYMLEMIRLAVCAWCSTS